MKLLVCAVALFTLKGKLKGKFFVCSNYIYSFLYIGIEIKEYVQMKQKVRRPFTVGLRTYF